MLYVQLTRLSLLNELNDDLMLELDDIVRQNQLASLPFAKSGRAEAELAERYPQLIESIARSKRIKVDSVSLQTRFHEREAKSVGGSKAKAAFFEDFEASPSASVNKPQRIPSRERTSQSKSPSLRAKNSTADLMFAMDEDSGLEEETNDMYTPTRHRRANPRAVDPLLPPSRLPIEDHFGGRLKGASAGVDDNIGESTSPLSFKSPGFTVSHPRRPAETSDSKQPWGSLAMGASKLDMKDIMAQASPRISNLSVGLAGPTRNNEAATTSIPAKLSQRERKKQQQLRSPLAVETQSPAIEDEHLPDRKLASPWQVTSVGPKISLKDVLGTERNESSSSQTGSTARTPSPLNLRQTVSGKVPTTRRTTSGPPQTLAPTQKRSISTPDTSKAALLTSPSSSSSKQPILSIRHTITPVEPSLQLSMADILSQQQTEKDIIKEAAAKRSLQEIQEEQAFQEWWDEESRKVKAEEEAAKPAARGGREARGKMRGGSRGRGRGRGEGGEGRRSGAARGGRKAGSGGKEEVKRK